MTDKTYEVDDTHLLNGKTWFDIKGESMLMPVESYVKLKEFILKYCKDDPRACPNTQLLR